MHRILVIGGGKIGSLISSLLGYSGGYTVFLADQNIDNPEIKRIGTPPNIECVPLYAEDPSSIVQFIKKNRILSVISSLPFYCNAAIAEAANECGTHYFDLTEDMATTRSIVKLSENTNTIFVPQCGLAPGFISIVAHHLMKRFPELDEVKMRVGALPVNVSNALQYSLTWSTDGLINEYGNLCHAIQDGKEVMLLPLDDHEEIKIDGLTYEAFNTSGGMGSLAETYSGKVRRLSYKTIRYPGHCAKFRFLMNDLKLNQRRDVLKEILENAIPKTYQDVVLVYVSVTGKCDGQYTEENFVKKFYPKKLNGVTWSAIQLTTASALCAVVDLVLNNPDRYRGWVRQEQFSYDELIENRFGVYFS